MRFRDRYEAGQQLAKRLASLRAEHPVVLGLPRGGVPVAAEVARALDAPLDVIVVRKLGLPFQPELGMGAIGEGGVRVLDEELMRRAAVGERELREVEDRERVELARRAKRFRGDRPPIRLDGRTVVLVDDGLATGGTARAAIDVARALGARRVVLAVPVAPPETVAALGRYADEVIALATPEDFRAIGEWYDDFSATGDDEVVGLLAHAHEPGRPASDGLTAHPERAGIDALVHIPSDTVTLSGTLSVPPAARGVVLFAHGSGSSRHSPRNRSVAETLQRAGLGTLLFDLLGEQEATDRSLVFDVELLARRLITATTWLRAQPGVGSLPIGYFGASTGAAAALWAAADPHSDVRAVVSRGGRPDLAGTRLAAVRCPTLLIVGGADRVVLGLNEEAAARLRCEHRLAVVRDATHLFDEPGALEAVARLASSWFVDHLPATASGMAS